jgi:hypothetical protein
MFFRNAGPLRSGSAFAKHRASTKENAPSMIRKSGSRFSEKIMLKQKIQRGMTIRRKVIPIERLKVGCNVSLR